jgi:hypothetical protein
MVPALLYGCENQTLTEQHERRTETADTKLLMPIAGYTFCDHKTNEAVTEELNTRI